jgi:hypothetical protein
MQKMMQTHSFNLHLSEHLEDGAAGRDVDPAYFFLL